MTCCQDLVEHFLRAGHCFSLTTARGDTSKKNGRTKTKQKPKQKREKEIGTHLQHAVPVLLALKESSGQPLDGGNVARHFGFASRGAQQAFYSRSISSRESQNKNKRTRNKARDAREPLTNVVLQCVQVLVVHLPWVLDDRVHQGSRLQGWTVHVQQEPQSAAQIWGGATTGMDEE